MFASVRTPSRNASTRPISDHTYGSMLIVLSNLVRNPCYYLRACLFVRVVLTKPSRNQGYVCFFLQDGASNYCDFEQLPLKYLSANVRCRREAEPPCATARIVARGPEPALQTKTMACLSRTVSAPKTKSWVARRKIREHR